MRKRKRHKQSNPGGLLAVAQSAGVSTATVSRALNGHRYVREDLRSRVFAAAVRLRYQPNPAARDLSRGRSSMVLIEMGSQLGFDLGRTALLRLLATELLAQGLYPVIAGDVPDNATHDGLLGLLPAVTSALILGASPILTPALRAHGLPYVLLDTPPAPADSAIQIDRVEGCAEAARHLIERGHRALCFVGQEDNLKWRGFAEAARAAGVPCTTVGTDELPLVLERQAGRSGITGWLLPSEASLIPALEMFARARVQLGRDAAAVCYGDTGLAENALLPLTTLRVPYEAMARMALALLADLQVHGVQPERRMMIKPELQVRASSDFPWSPATGTRQMLEKQ